METDAVRCSTLNVPSCVSRQNDRPLSSSVWPNLLNMTYSNTHWFLGFVIIATNCLSVSQLKQGSVEMLSSLHSYIHKSHTQFQSSCWVLCYTTYYPWISVICKISRLCVLENFRTPIRIFCYSAASLDLRWQMTYGCSARLSYPPRLSASVKT